MQQLEHWQPFLQQMGLEMRALGETTVAIDALPLGMTAVDAGQIMANLDQWQADFVEDKAGKKIARSLCHIVKNKKQHFAAETASMIIEKLLKTTDPFYDPLGTPIIVEMQETYLAGLFKKR